MKPLAARIAPYEVFFPLAAIACVVALSLSLVALAGAWTPPGGLTALEWHAHEMLFGHFPAAFAGVMLTALPRWTGAPPLAVLRLLALAGLWLAARLAFLFAPTSALLALSPAYVAALAITAGVTIVRAGDRRDLGLVALLALFAVADALFLLGAPTGDTAQALRLGLSAAAVAAMVMGGRVAPALTRHLAEKQGRVPAPPTPWRFEVIVLGLAVAALAAWVAAPLATSTAILLAIAALAHVARLVGWAGWTTIDRPPFLALHLGYACLPLGLALQAAAILTADLRLSDAGVHAWGVGTFGLMCAAILTSVIRRYAGRGLAVSHIADVMVAALLLAATLRLAASFADLSDTQVWTAALGWSIAWIALLVLVVRDRRLPAPSPTRASTSAEAVE